MMTAPTEATLAAGRETVPPTVRFFACDNCQFIAAANIQNGVVASHSVAPSPECLPDGRRTGRIPVGASERNSRFVYILGDGIRG
jgi:hypothetical protein